MKVIVLMALTVDGFIGRSGNDFPNWSGSADKKLFRQVSSQAGVVIMGSRTFDTIGKPLKGRKNVIMTRNKDRRSIWENLVYTNQEPADLLRQLEKEGYREVVLAGGSLVNTLFARQNLIDELYLTYSPIIFGAGVSLFSEPVSMELDLIDFSDIGEDRILARYRVVK